MVHRLRLLPQRHPSPVRMTLCPVRLEPEPEVFPIRRLPELLVRPIRLPRVQEVLPVLVPQVVARWLVEVLLVAVLAQLEPAALRFP